MIPYNTSLPKKDLAKIDFRKHINAFYKFESYPEFENTFQLKVKFRRKNSLDLTSPIILTVLDTTEAGTIYVLNDSSGISFRVFFSHAAPNYGCGNYKDSHFFVRRAEYKTSALYLVFVKSHMDFPQFLFQCFFEGGFNKAMREIINRHKKY